MTQRSQLASPAVGEEVCITGIAGRFPNSSNVAEYMSNLFNKVDMCDDDERRWSHVYPEIPRFSGKIYDIERFDSGYFGYENYHANYMDPMGRMVLERTVEAIFDAGLNPNALRGTKTGVFIATSMNDAEHFTYFELNKPDSHSILSCFKSMLPQRIAYHLQLIGPAVTLDAACSSALYAVEHAYRAIREGKCDQAIVGGTHLAMSPFLTLQFSRMNVLNMNTGCRPFDKDATGYTRSEAIIAIFLQKSKDANRIYGKVVHAKCNCDGYKKEGQSFPSSEAHIRLFTDIYTECNVSPRDVGFIEAHGTGTKVGDPVEMMGLDKFFCKNRNNPLLSGSVKSNIGHTEPVAGLCSLVKVLCAMYTGNIPPNIHYDNPNDGIAALTSKRIKIIEEVTPWPKYSVYGGVNAFGFGGSNAHVLLERNSKSETSLSMPIPTLVCLSARTIDGLQSLQNFAASHKANYSVLCLLQNIFKSNVNNYMARGFCILSDHAEIKRSSVSYNGMKKPLYVCVGNDWMYNMSMIHNLTKFDVGLNTINLINKIMNENQLVTDTPNKKLASAMITMTAQISIIEILKCLKIEFSKIRSYSNIDFVSHYANESLNLEETIKCTYAVTKLYTEQDKSNNNCLEILETILGNRQRNVNSFEILKSNKYQFASAKYFIEILDNLPKLADFDEIDKMAVVLTLNCTPKVHKQRVINIPDSSQIDNILTVIGELYDCGHNLDLTRLYSQVEWPVNRGTPMISPAIGWNHKHSFFYAAQLNDIKMIRDAERTVSISNDAALMKGHIVDGRNFYPAMGYMLAIWQFFADVNRLVYQALKIRFRNVKFIRAHTINQNKSSTIDGFYLQILKSGYFEICEKNSTLVTGYLELYEGKINNHVEYHSSKYKLSKEDLYKEYKLRGYNYKGHFQGMHELSSTSGLIEWNNNFISFLDNMLQMSMVHENTKALYIPTGIEEMLIDASNHLNYVKEFQDNLIPVNVDKKTNIIKTKFIEIRGFKVTSISRKRHSKLPVIERNIFLPNMATISIEDSVRITIQLLIETKQLIRLKVIELIDRNGYDYLPFAPYINDAIKDVPIIQSEILIFSNQVFSNLDDNTKVKKLAQFTPTALDNNNNLFVGINLLQDVTKLQDINNFLASPGFIISIEDKLNENIITDHVIFTIHRVNDKYIHLIKRKMLNVEATYIDVSDMAKMNEWIPNIQTRLHSCQDLILYAHNNSSNGILGFINCLRREPSGEKVRCVFIMDEAIKFDPDNELFSNQLRKEMAINVWKNGEWGTYRHLLLPPPTALPNLRYSVLNTIGDLSTIRWEGCSISPENLADNSLVYTNYCALNFRDVMLATGKLAEEIGCRTRKPLQSLFGVEFSGKMADGRRVMGLSAGGSLTNIIERNKSNVCWFVPDNWSLAEAATVPVVYSTVLSALKHCTIKEGQSILIHSGTGGIGLAAINVCTYLKLNIFTTVGSKEKMEYLLKTYPHLKRSHIGNSRDTSFEQMVYKETNGIGVKYVLNSLSEEKLQASVRCLAKNGVFLEIGKYDISKDSILHMDLMAKNCAFYSIMLDLQAQEGFDDVKVKKVLNDAIAEGYVKPLPYVIFEQTDCEAAFRYMTTGKHVGKVLLQINEDIGQQANRLTKMTCLPRFTANPNLSYVIIGGLGGFGLELADWLVMRGVKYLILSSRSGVTNGYQHRKIRIWKSFNVCVIVSTEDVTSYDGCKNLLKKSESIAPIAAIFNLAVVLKDAIFENQTCELFQASLKPKAIATKYIDAITRQCCRKLEYFVVFSSLSCGRGNAGQTNYGMSNSIMERICELRKKDGFPALAIQWGAVGDVGLVAEVQKDQSEIAMGGTLQQRISNCLEMMDRFLTQNETIVSSFIVGEKHGIGCEGNMVDSVAKIIGIKDLKTISLHSTLPELGMDSLMVIEIKQVLEIDYDVFLSTQDIHALTFAKLIKLNSGISNKTYKTHKGGINNNNNILNQTQFTNSLKNLPFVQIKKEQHFNKTIFFFPGIDNNIARLKCCTENLSANVICGQYPNEYLKQVKVEDIVNYLWEHLQKYLPNQKSFNMVAYSYGSIIALEIAAKLEELGFICKIALLDASPKLVVQLSNLHNSSSDDLLEINCIVAIMSTILSSDQLKSINEELLKRDNYSQRKEIAMKYLPDDLIGKENFIEVCDGMFYRIKSVINYTFKKKLNSKMLLCKTTIPTIKTIAEDYDLGDISTQRVDIECFQGDHQTILANPKLHEKLSHFFDNKL